MGDIIKLIIKNVTTSDAGKVECIVDKDHCMTQLVIEDEMEAEMTEKILVMI